eukprot:GHVS01015648.1.p1 GENE.GHVS01015648.1~~GHVS01015648.1.p1  ORF type:complete len:152 (-),score=16.23 GHVS01015648.1:1-417(-)
MESSVSAVSKHMNINVARLEVWHNKENMIVLQQLDRKSRCGGLPYYYNTRTCQWICGATTTYNLHLWASDQHCKASHPPPLKDEDMAAFGRKTGFFARLTSRLDEIREKGQLKMRERLEREMHKRSNATKRNNNNNKN